MIAELPASASDGKVWVRFKDPRLSRLIPDVLGDELGHAIAHDEAPDFSNVGIVIVDDAHADILVAARADRRDRTNHLDFGRCLARTSRFCPSGGCRRPGAQFGLFGGIGVSLASRQPAS
ncbi:hypothetical protein [Maricaulis sp. MIT060901]|uniref:hypothetical protein n=1 Tax=Maricaulis sp. MIT060901 TaxID=3096993 RepID=UPI00399A1E67